MTACADCHFNNPDCSKSSSSSSSDTSNGSSGGGHSSASNNHSRWNRQAERALRDKKNGSVTHGTADNQLFTTQITHFEIDVAYLHANQHFNSAQIWANLEKKYAPVNLVTGERNEKCMRGLFPRLVSLDCNHWLPSPHFLRLLRGIPSPTPTTLISSSSIVSSSTSTVSRSDNSLSSARSSSQLPIHLSLSPGKHNTSMTAAFTALLHRPHTQNDHFN